MFDLKKYLVAGIVLTSIFLVVGCSSNQVADQNQTGTQVESNQQQPSAPQPQGSYQEISPEQAKQLIDSDKTLQLIDVREQDEYDQGYIKGTTLIPMSQFVQRMGEIDKSRTVLLYCAVGSRSAQAGQVLAQNGYKVYNIANGLENWTYGLEK